MGRTVSLLDTDSQIRHLLYIEGNYGVSIDVVLKYQGVDNDHSSLSLESG